VYLMDLVLNRIHRVELNNHCPVPAPFDGQRPERYPVATSALANREYVLGRKTSSHGRTVGIVKPRRSPARISALAQGGAPRPPRVTMRARSNRSTGTPRNASCASALSETRDPANGALRTWSAAAILYSTGLLPNLPPKAGRGAVFRGRLAASFSSTYCFLSTSPWVRIPPSPPLYLRIVSAT
jgi:hypothetical protein